MKYYPKYATAISLVEFYNLVENDLRQKVIEEMKEDNSTEEEIENYVHPLTELLDTWEDDVYDEELFEAVYEEYGVTPMRIGSLTDERGGETTGVSGFVDGFDYVFFDTEEQDEELWNDFLLTLSQHNIEVHKGSWSQLG